MKTESTTKSFLIGCVLAACIMAGNAYRADIKEFFYPAPLYSEHECVNYRHGSSSTISFEGIIVNKPGEDREYKLWSYSEYEDYETEYTDDGKIVKHHIGRKGVIYSKSNTFSVREGNELFKPIYCPDRFYQ